MKTEEEYNAEVLQLMRDLYPTLKGEERKRAERLFPELKESKESEDEKIKGAAIEFVRQNKSFNYRLGISKEEVIAWLEKQGEQNNNEDADILYRFSFYSYKDEPNVIYLSGFYVNEEYRNKGIGTKILEVADEITKSLDCHAIRLKTKKDSDAERLYQTHGYNSLSTEGKDEIWLEKQAEQKSADKVEPKFKTGTYVVYLNDTYMLEDDGKHYILTAVKKNASTPVVHIHYGNEDYTMRKWNIANAKDGDVLVDKDNNIGIYKEIEGIFWNSYIYLGCDGKLRGFSIGGNHEQTDTHPATKEQRHKLEKAIMEAGYKWNKEDLKLEKI